MREELDMMFLLEHFSLSDLQKAEENFCNYQDNNTDNIEESVFTDIDEEGNVTEEYLTYINYK